MRVEVEVTVEDLVDGLLRGNLVRDEEGMILTSKVSSCLVSMLMSLILRVF
jgi:hypothetical protein